MTKSETKSDTSDREIVVSRLIRAPIGLVWQAFSDPAHIAHWWGPHGFTTTTHHMDMRPGGEWRFVMHGPDGTDYENRISYIEVEKPRLLHYRHSGDGETRHIRFTSRVTLEEAGAGTRVILHIIADSKAERDMIAKTSGAEEGGRQTLFRLDEHLASQPGPDGTPLVITRTFKAPRRLVWQALTEARHLAQWWGPKGCRAEVKHLEVKPGGHFHYVLRFSTGAEMWGLFTYDTVEPPERIVYRSSFSDSDGGKRPAPFPGDWPIEIENVMTLGEWEGTTTLRLVSRGLSANPAESAFFESMFGSMQQGWGGTFDVLEKYLDGVQGYASETG